MQNIQITTGIISGYNYHQNNQILDITSNDGTMYQYFEVPENIIKELKNADKPGDYYRKCIRKKFKRLFKAYDY